MADPRDPNFNFHAEFININNMIEQVQFMAEHNIDNFNDLFTCFANIFYIIYKSLTTDQLSQLIPILIILKQRMEQNIYPNTPELRDLILRLAGLRRAVPGLPRDGIIHRFANNGAKNYNEFMTLFVEFTNYVMFHTDDNAVIFQLNNLFQHFTNVPISFFIDDDDL